MMRQRGELGSIKVYPFDRIGQAMRDLEAGPIMADYSSQNLKISDASQKTR
jgi:hypothetical protein